MKPIKIGSDILKIVWRFKWQSKLNCVIREYFTKYKPIKFVCFDSNGFGKRAHGVVLYKYVEAVLLNNRELSGDVGRFLRYNYIKCKYSMMPANYIYTSTKYLREIKESGINCLSINDNVKCDKYWWV